MKTEQETNGEKATAGRRVHGESKKERSEHKKEISRKERSGKNERK